MTNYIKTISHNSTTYQVKDKEAVTRGTSTSSIGSTNYPVYVDSTGTVQASSNSIINTRFDGQWVSKVQQLSTVTAVGTYTIDLSYSGTLSYLPNDNYNYEVACLIYTYYNGSSTTNRQCMLSPSSSFAKSGTYISTCPSTYGIVTNVEQRMDTNTSYGILPVSSAKKLYFVIASNGVTENFVYAYGYRRVGTNT